MHRASLQARHQTDRTFNGEMLSVARCSRAVSQSDLAKNLRTSQGRVSKLENGLLEPPEDLIQRLANFLEYPESFFYQPDPVFGLSLSLYRKKQSLPKKFIDRLEAETTIKRMNIAKLLQATEPESDHEVPVLDVDDYEGGAAEIALLVRATWMIPGGPIKNVMEVVENGGTIIVPLSFKPKGVDAISQFTPGLPPLIFIDTDFPTDRLRFSIAHELGHLVMHRHSPSPKMENEANAFASEFLMPRNDIQSAFSSSLKLSDLAALKPIWRVSMGALLERARRIGKIQEGYHRYLRAQMSKGGWTRREPPETNLKPEKPFVLAETIQFHLEHMGYTTQELARTLHYNLEEFMAKFILIEDDARRLQHLRLIN